MEKKAGEIVTPEEMKKIEDDVCGVCHTHEQAYKVLPQEMNCPHCNGVIEYAQYHKDDLVVVGETNTYDPEEKYRMMWVENCEHCGQRIGFLPVPITYNGNHDIYYTGGKEYVPTQKFQMTDEMKKNIENYHKRILAGEKLEPWNLITWLTYDMEHYVADILYKHGLKI